MSTLRDGRVTAVLGPTNTGKTHLAIERMLGHASGIIGFPLRLLARENYERVVRRKGARQVALITGEEKIVPPQARYFLCTVEAMPDDRPVDFLAVDEIQLAADPERGHIFTDRLLRARGREETMFLGADTIRPLLARLVPEAQVISRPRLSVLSYVGPKKLTRLPARTAVVAFSAAEVYAMAELLRRQRGGTAVVLGALSPRTRNAQVELFESGEVDYLVATDAIGMGLNLELDHVAFARLVKFDGHLPRRLAAPEVAQIAGRAGRHMNDGTFGTTGEEGPLDPDLVAAVEGHRFDPLTAVYWRNARLDYRSPAALLRSLEMRPSTAGLLRVRAPEDQQALAGLLRDESIVALASDPEGVRLLWDVCQIPDFRKILSDQHARLLGQIFRHLRRNHHRLPDAWVAQQIARIDRTDGDIDTLIARIAHIRTWTFISHRAAWLDDAVHWQERARDIEDKLSDALHERLTQRFVDRRAATLVKRLKTGEPLIGSVNGGGEVFVEGESVGRLSGFRFHLEADVGRDDARALLAAARRVLHGEIRGRLARLEADDDGAFRMDSQGRLYWREAPVARLAAGSSPLYPRVQAEDSEFLDGPSRERLRRRLDHWLSRYLRKRLGPLYDLEEATLQGAARGLAFQLAESLGTLPRGRVRQQLAQIARSERRRLADLKVRLGTESVFLPMMLKPATIHLRALLWSLWRGRPSPVLPDPLPPCLRGDHAADTALCLALGYRRFHGRGANLALRADALERLAGAVHRRARDGAFRLDDGLFGIVDCSEAELTTVLVGLGYRPANDEGALRFHRRGKGGNRRPQREARRRRQEESPFAALRQLQLG